MQDAVLVLCITMFSNKFKIFTDFFRKMFMQKNLSKETYSPKQKVTLFRKPAITECSKSIASILFLFLK